jgi:hypothetical protein
MQASTMKFFLPCLAVALAWAGNAKADLSMEVKEDGNTFQAVNLVASGGTFTADGVYSSGVGVGAPDFNFSSFTVGSTLGASMGSLTGSGSITATGDSSHTLTILISDKWVHQPCRS